MPSQNSESDDQTSFSGIDNYIYSSNLLNDYDTAYITMNHNYI